MHLKKSNNSMNQIQNNSTFFLAYGYCKNEFEKDIPNDIILFIYSLITQIKIGYQPKNRELFACGFYLKTYTLFFHQKYFSIIKKDLQDLSALDENSNYEENSKEITPKVSKITFYQTYYFNKTKRSIISDFFNQKKYHTIELSCSDNINQIVKKINVAETQYYQNLK